MEELDVAVAVAELKKEVGSLKHRMDRMEKIVDAVHSLALEMTKQTEEIKHMNQSIQQLNADVAGLKEKPANRWENVVTTFIGAVAGAAAALFLK